MVADAIMFLVIGSAVKSTVTYNDDGTNCAVVKEKIYAQVLNADTNKLNHRLI